jgi:hypothetical protein
MWWYKLSREPIVTLCGGIFSSREPIFTLCGGKQILGNQYLHYVEVTTFMGTNIYIM